MITKSIIQRGYSLIELMISAVLGLFLIAVAMTSYSSNKSTYTLRDATGDIESNARVALYAITRAVEHAGYPSIHVYTIEKPFYTLSDGVQLIADCGANNHQAKMRYATQIFDEDRTTKDSSTEDRLSVLYMPDNPNDPNAIYWQDCGGSYNSNSKAENCSADPSVGKGKDARVYNSFFIDEGNELKCTTSRNESYLIANGIEHVQYLYGVRKSGNTLYQDATTVEANQDWGSVISVQVGLLVKSTDPIKAKNESITHAVLGMNITKNDRYLRKVYTSTIYLKNMDRVASN